MKLSRLLILGICLFANICLSQEGEGSAAALRKIEIRMSYYEQAPKESPLLGSEIDIRFELSEELPIHFFQSLVNDKFLFARAAYVSQVKDIVAIRPGFSKAFKARAAFISPIVPQTDYTMKLEGVGVELKIINLNVEVMNDPSLAQIQKPQIVNQEYTEQINYTQYLLIGGFLSSILIVLFIYFWLRRRESRLELAYQNKWRKFILNAKTRNELEKIYLLRRKWKTVLGLKASNVNSFSRVINKYQYQEIWSIDELALVKKALSSSLEIKGRQ